MHIRYFIELLLIKSILSINPHLNSYTAFNCVLWLITILSKTRQHYWPFLFTNTLALTCTFYTTGFIIDTTFFQRMRDAHGYSMTKFIVGDVFFHLIPSIYLIWSLFYRSKEWCEIFDNITNRHIEYIGFISMLSNIIWGFMYEFEPKHIYVPNKTNTWRLIWTFNAIYHIFSAYFLEIPKQVIKRSI